MPKEVKLLYIDDEEGNLNSFKATFRRDWNVFTAVNHKEALDILNANEIQIIISDQRMPEKTGVEFFSQIKTEFPESIRILLTGFADMNAVIDAINSGEIYRYFTKPWNAELLNEAFVHCSEIYKNRKEIKEKDEALLESYKELESFVYSASHDLRAPLVSILGVVKLARAQKEKGEIQIDYLSLIEKSVGNLDKFVKNIINYYQNRKQSLKSSAVDLDKLIEDVYSSFEHYDGAHSINFKKELNGVSIVNSDELRLKIILNNLISNAIKYHDSEKEEQWVSVTAHSSDDGFEIHVEDNGKGIPTNQVDKVFEMFFTGSNGKSLGTGIGLHIVKEAVNKIDAKISLTSEEGIGTKFSVIEINELHG